MRRRKNKEKAETPDSLQRFALPIQVALALTVLGVYGSTLYPSVAGGDSGEFIVAAQELGVAHPPGYPLYTLLGKIFTWLPTGTVAWRVNLLTAVLGALAATVLARATWRATRNVSAGIFAGGLFAFSPLVWRYSIQAEVFALNNLFVAILVLLLVSHEIDGKESTLGWFCFAFGLGLTNHHTLLFVGVPFAIWMLFRAPRATLAWPRILRLPGLGAAGLLPYLYLLVSPADHPSTTWGATSSLSGFIEHFLRKQYGTLQLGTMEQGGSLGERLGAYLLDLPGQLLWVGAALAVAGTMLRFAKSARYSDVQRSIVTIVSATVVFYLVVFHGMTKISIAEPFWYEVLSRFWQQANLLVCLLAGVGLACLVGRAGRIGSVLAPVIAVAVLLTQLDVNYAKENQSRNHSVEQLTVALLEALPPNSVLITKGDLYWNSVAYMQFCEGLRGDVRILDVEMLKAPWMTDRVQRNFDDLDLPGRVYRAPSKKIAGSYDLAALFGTFERRTPVFSNALDHGDPSWKGTHISWPDGLLDRVYRKNSVIDVDEWLQRTDRWIAETEIDFADPVPEGSWEHIAREELRKVESRRGAHLLTEAAAGRLSDVQLGKVPPILERAAAMRDEPSAVVQLNLGISYYLLRGKQPGAVRKMVEAWRIYLQVAPSDDPQRPVVEQALRNPATADIGIGAR